MCAACLVWRSSDTSLNASAVAVFPDSLTASMTSGFSTVGWARTMRSSSPSGWNWFIRKPTVPSFMPYTGLVQRKVPVKSAQHEAVATERDDDVRLFERASV